MRELRSNNWRRSAKQGSAAAIVAGVVAAISGCAGSKPGPTQTDIVRDSIGTQTVRGAWAEAAETGTVPDGWLKSFNDPKMEEMVIEALRHNLVLRGAATRMDAAAAAAVKAGAAMKPAIGVGGGSAGATGVSSTGSGGGVGLNVSWELDLWGRLASIVSAAEEQLASVQADYEFARESLAAQTAKAWYLASNAQQQLTLARENVKVFEELARVVKVKSDAGQVSPQDMNLAQSDLASAKERERFAEGAHKEAVRSLEVLLGRYPSAELEVAEHFVPVPAAVPAGIPSEMLERRPDLFAAEANVRAAFQNVQAAELAKLPQVTLSAGGGLGGLASGFFGIGGNFFMPLDTNGELQAEVEIQTANQEAALAAYGQSALVAFNEVENALAAEGLLAEREELLKTALQKNDEALRIARVQYDAGKVTMLDVLQLQARSNLSRAALIDMQQQRLAQRIDLHLALGGGFETSPGASAPERPATRPASADASQAQP